MKWYTPLIGLMVLSVLAGCGGSGIDENKPVDQVAAEAAQMSQAELQKMVDKYQSAIADKSKEVEALKEKLQQIPISDLMSDEARKLKGEASDVMDSLDKLKAQLSACTRELAKK